MSFGKYPDVTLAKARERLDDARRVLAAGLDPMAQKKSVKAATRGAETFRAITAKWLEHWAKGKSERHVDYVRRRMEADILPQLGARPIQEVKASELRAMAQAIEKRGAKDLAKRALQTTGQIFAWAVAHDFAQRNPAKDIKPSDILESTRKPTTPASMPESCQPC